MAGTDAAATSAVHAVRAELNLHAPTTHTLKFLRAILGFKCPETACPQATKPVKGRQPVKSRTGLKVAFKNGRTAAPGFKILEEADHKAPPLSEVDRRKIATETFNVTLKQLGQACKSEKNAHRLGVSPHTPSKPPPTKRALNERSPNREKKEHISDTKATLPCASQPNYEVVVECSFAALQYLRECDDSGGAVNNEQPAGTDNAALILLDRTIALNLLEQARRQLYEVHRRYWQQTSKTPSSKPTTIAHVLLGRADSASQKSTFGFTTSLQSQGLRLALLEGAKCIDKELLISLQLDTVGSPAWVTLQGLQNGQHRADQAGLQLQTISLALTKLYSTASKSKYDKLPSDDVFCLFCTALRIKFESWTHLGHKPDPEMEVWRQFRAAVKKFCANAKDVQASMTFVLRYLRQYQNLLRAANSSDIIPPELIETLLQHCHGTHVSPELLVLLEEQVPTADGVGLLILNCQITVSRLKSFSTAQKPALDSIQQTNDAFAAVSDFSQAQLDRVLLHVAHLRKAAVDTMMTIEKSQKQELENLQAAIIKLIYTCLKFVWSQTQTSLLQTSQETVEPRKLAFLTMIIKNMDATLSAEKCTATQTSILTTLACDTLQYCLDIVKLLQPALANLRVNDPVRLALNQFQVQLSHALWFRFLKAAEERKGAQEQVQFLQSSLQALSALSSAEQKAAYLGLKYERLAACYLEIDDYHQARSAVQQAIGFNIKEGTLNDTVELLLAGPSHAAWASTETNGKALARNLAMHVRISLLQSSATANEPLFHDCRSLPAIHRVVLFEKQVYALMETEMTAHQSNLCAVQVNFMLELLHQEEHQIYKLRFVNTLIHSALKRRMSASEVPLDLATVDKILAPSKKQSKTIFLQAYESGLRCLLVLQYGFLTSEITREKLEQAVKQLGDILRKCKTLDAAREFFDDLGMCIRPLQLSADYAALFEIPKTGIMALETLHHILEIGYSSSELTKVSVLLQMGKAYDSLQDSPSAAKAFETLEKQLGHDKPDSLFEAEFALAYSEHYLNTENSSQCFDWLDRARCAWGNRLASGSTKSGKERLREQTVLSGAAQVASRLAYNNGQLSEATTCARQSVKIAAALWMSIERIWQSDTSLEDEISSDSGLQGLSTGFSKLDLSFQKRSRVTANAAMHWPQVSLYCSTFRSFARLSAHCGLYQDAVYFSEQALNVARKTMRTTLARLIMSELSLLHARGSHFEKARKQLQDVGVVDVLDNHNMVLDQVLTSINQSDIYLHLGDVCSAQRHFYQARDALQPKKKPTKQPEIVPKNRRKAIITSTKISSQKPSSKLQSKPVAGLDRSQHDPPAIFKPTMDLKVVRDRISVLATELRLLENHPLAADGDDSASTFMTNAETPRQLTVEALILVQSALKLFSEDAIRNALAETAMALPVRYKSSRKSGRVSFVQHGASHVMPEKKAARKSKAAGQSRVEHGGLKDGRHVLIEAYRTLSRLKEFPQARISSEIFHTAHKILAQITLLSTGLGHPFVNSSLELVLDTLSPMDIASNRERTMILGEVATSERTNIQKWPGLKGLAVPTQSMDADNYLHYDMDLLPASWSVVSLGLNEDRSELLVSRLTAERSPFMVRIPLTRPDLSDAENGELDFLSAKAEIQRIVSHANSTAHDPRGSSVDKTARKAWYAERKSLDGQLATLLDNIENVWFGGFRGLLCAFEPDDSALLKFGQSFSVTLNRHLPSRQKLSKTSDTKIELHDHVLELFVTLGHPRGAELEDSITDLLYFVIDILQFNGEPNAYDEIDFDAIVVEVLDALHVYHEEKSKGAKNRQGSHVIMVMDKELQAFPWESLSCLRGHAVSRMPSLGAIWERLEAVHRQKGSTEGLTIPSTQGAYILNPSSDLTSTQDTFGQLFDEQLVGFDGIVRRAPKEQEFETALHDKSLVLYFGHGGGAQFIRGRTIRKLDKCAVTLLMGCSSAKMTECGVYEPYGMPWNYINGGSAAVVGTLWDVTDRDIDRFALELMAGWGLIEAAGVPEGTQETKAGKRRAEKEKISKGPCHPQQRGMVSLDEAVAQARDGCLLRYLNGAAPVMYGIPVFLE